ncbi:MAG: 1-deoxy-D-xylulose-5-phosphate reductoisomerase [Eubacteriales bacterium]|nr:1-deoxy-D-xylulose-5-phosphate reductoisomerase [Eubacteriales bacterium]
MKRIAILGSTGSIGTQTLDVLALHPDEYRVTILAAAENAELLAEQARRFRPELVYLKNQSKRETLRARLPEGTKVFDGRLEELCAYDGAEVFVIAVVGIAGLPAVLACIRNGKEIALANKEALVTGGAVVTKALQEAGMRIRPVDSEHSAIAQCLAGNREKDVESILLTASGGPFRTWEAERIRRATAAEALAHPNWSMGKKVTVDSASMMNKALEIIEARWLFDMEPDRIRVLVHPQSIVHSAVEFRDGSVIAQLGVPDMRTPILYALSGPARLTTGVKRLDLAERGALTFENVDEGRFPFVPMAYEVLKTGGSASVVFNAANEIAAAGFLAGDYSFGGIFDVVCETLQREAIRPVRSAEDIFEADEAARARARQIAQNRKEI